MAIVPISKDDFDRRSPVRTPLVQMLAIEKSWFADSDRNMIGAVIFDKTDKDWNYVVLALHEDGNYRWIDGNSSYPDLALAESKLVERMAAIDETGKVVETLFSDQDDSKPENTSVLFNDINFELKKYFKKNPEHLHQLSPRKFEELIASILKDFGFSVELTQATRDGGRDIIAYLRNAVCSYLTYVECKKYSSENKVGVGVIREVVGVHNIRRATKSMIVTTSFFTQDAKSEAEMVENQLELKDYDALKGWLANY
jgi:HJR/Mrr/RecB family endonuclease